jgi:hypothetical protein
VPTSCVANVILAGDRVALGPDASPVPLKATDWGVAIALSVMVSKAVRGPA